MVECVVDDRYQQDECDNVGRDQLCVPVHEEDYDQCRKDKGCEYKVHRMHQNVELVCCKDPDKCVERLDYSVSRRYLGSAGSALSAEQTPAQDRDKITVLDLSAAGHTV